MSIDAYEQLITVVRFLNNKSNWTSILKREFPMQFLYRFFTTSENPAARKSVSD